MIVYDAHAHAGSAEEIALRAQSKLLTVLSCGNNVLVSVSERTNSSRGKSAAFKNS